MDLFNRRYGRMLKKSIYIRLVGGYAIVPLSGRSQKRHLNLILLDSLKLRALA